MRLIDCLEVDRFSTRIVLIFKSVKMYSFKKKISEWRTNSIWQDQRLTSESIILPLKVRFPSRLGSSPFCAQAADSSLSLTLPFPLSCPVGNQVLSPLPLNSGSSFSPSPLLPHCLLPVLLCLPVGLNISSPPPSCPPLPTGESSKILKGDNTVDPNYPRIPCLWICSLKFTWNPKINILLVLSQSFMDICRAEKRTHWHVPNWCGTRPPSAFLV